MSHIACSSNNSFAIDNEGHLYTWGSCESGLLGFVSDKHIEEPLKKDVKYGNDTYFAEKVFAGPFHVAVVGKRINKVRKNFAVLQKETEGLSRHFKELIGWFTEKVKVKSPEEIISIICRKQDNQNFLKYAEFEKLFLRPYWKYLELNGRDFFHMRETYEEYLSEILGFTKNKPTFEISDIQKLAESKKAEVKDLYEFANQCYQHFCDYPEDFSYFAKFVFQFKSEITFEDVNQLLEYCPSLRGKPELKNSVSKKLIDLLVIRVNNDRGGGKIIESNVLIDIITGEDTAESNVLTWGVNAKGRLGYKDCEKVASSTNKMTDDGELVQIQYNPKLVYFRKYVKIKEVACGFYHTLALTINGSVYAWGTAKYGCLGKYLKQDQYTPIEIEVDSDKKPFKDIVQIAAGMFMSLALTEKGRVYSWGLGNKGRLGHGNENSTETPKKIQYFIQENITIEQISAGDLHCAAISQNKELYTWGNGTFGKLGHCNFDNVLQPKFVSYFSNQKVKSVFCGSYNTMAITTDSKVFVWGKNAHGMLGIPQMVDQNLLYPPELLYQKDDESLKATEIAIATMHTMILCQDGNLLTCGNSVNGVLGIEGVIDKITYPREVEQKFFMTQSTELLKGNPIFKEYKDDFSRDGITEKVATSLSYLDCSCYNTAFITNDGQLYMSGRKDLKPTKRTDEGNSSTAGEEEEDEDSDINIITKIGFFREKVSYISLGKEHAICIAEGKAYSWGRNTSGVCGLSGKSTGDRISIPTLIDSIKSGSKMCCVSDTHSMILTVNGEIYACGSNMYGKLGVCDLGKYFAIGVTPMEPEFVLVKNVSDVRYIACSNYHSACIVKSQRENTVVQDMYTWGNGLDGKLGHGGVQDSYEPQLVEEFASKGEETNHVNIMKIALGDDFSLALDDTGKLWGWGKKKYLPGSKKNTDGKQELPTQLGNKTSFKFIAAKNNFGCAINVAGEIFSWGEVITQESSNYYPFSDLKQDSMSFVSIGFNHCAGIDTSGIPYSWGNNLYNKCGQEAVNEVVSDISEPPKKIDRFALLFGENINSLKKEDNADRDEEDEKGNINLSPEEREKNKKLEEANTEGRDVLQIKLLDEPSDGKSKGLVVQDIKVNDSFFNSIQKLFETLRGIEIKRSRLLVFTEDMIVSDLNKMDVKIKEKFESEIPFIYTKNFHYFEKFIQLLQSHPCYFSKLYMRDQSPANLMKTIQTVFGKNIILLRNKRVITCLTAIWNSILFNQKTIDQISSKNNDFDLPSSVIYELYLQLYKINEENINFSNELISVGFLVVFTKVLEKEYFNLDKDAERIIMKLKTFNAKTKGMIIHEVKKKLRLYISETLTDLNNCKKLSYPVLWMISKFIKIANENMSSKDKEKNNDKEKNIIQCLNNFIFNPCNDIMNRILNSNEQNLPEDFYKLSLAIPEFILSPYSQREFAKLYNDFKAKNSNSTSSFETMCHPKSEILKFVSEIFKEMVVDDHKVDKVLDAFNDYNFDFTINAIREQVKYLSENANTRTSVPVTIRNLIEVQNNFEQIKGDLDPNDPLIKNLDYLRTLSEHKLDSASPINNIVVNVYFSPYSFYFKNNANKEKETKEDENEEEAEQKEECEMLKCKDCLLPIPSIFLTKEKRENCKNGEEWICSNEKCKEKMEGADRKLIECKKCGQLKPIKYIQTNAFFFQRFAPADVSNDTTEVEDLLEKVMESSPDDKKEELYKYIKEESLNLKDTDKETKKKKILYEKFIKEFDSLVKRKYLRQDLDKENQKETKKDDKENQKGIGKEDKESQKEKENQKDTRKENKIIKELLNKDTIRLADLLEKVYEHLPPLHSQDNIYLIVQKELLMMKESKEKDKSKYKNEINLFESFMKQVDHLKEKKYSSEEKVIEEAKEMIEELIEQRSAHRDYLQMIEESINFIQELTEEAKVNFLQFKDIVGDYRKNLEKGYVCKLFMPLNGIVPKIKEKKKQIKTTFSKRYLVKDLMEKGILNQISFDNPQLLQKSYIELEKNKDGLNIKLSYEEKLNNFISTTTHNYNLDELTVSNEKILDLRDCARHNQIVKLEGISFNAYYLVKLMNELMNE
ncbi:MAG: hypothetical protein MJ252_03975 [archaeon]|nr:hypothetical protein [archaeon]